MVLTAALIGLYGVLCTVAGYALGERVGTLRQFRAGEVTAEVLEFMAGDEEIQR